MLAYRAASFRSCLSELHGLATIQGSALRARASLRLGNADGAFEAARSTGDSHYERAELAMLRATAASRLGNVTIADEAFTEARAHGYGSADTSLATEIGYYVALHAFGQGKLEAARRLTQSALGEATTVLPFSQTQGLIPLHHLVARNQVLLGVIDAAEGRYGDELVHTRAALETLDANPTMIDVYESAVAIRNFAIIARDFDIEDDAVMIAERAEALAWTQDIRRIGFTTFESLGWCSALRGDLVDALRRFRTAADAASTPPEEILIGVDRAFIAREAGHRALVIEEVERALTIAESYDWENAPDDYRLYLLPLAQVAASISPARARDMLTRYASIRKAMSGLFVARIEDRTRAEEAYSEGIVLRAEGRENASTERLASAFATWDGIGYQWRAGCAALELAELGAGDVFRLAVARELRRRPRSIFAERARLVA